MVCGRRFGPRFSWVTICPRGGAVRKLMVWTTTMMIVTDALIKRRAIAQSKRIQRSMEAGVVSIASAGVVSQWWESEANGFVRLDPDDSDKFVVGGYGTKTIGLPAVGPLREE